MFCFCVLWHAYIFHMILYSFMHVTGDFLATVCVQLSMSHFVIDLELFMFSQACHTLWLTWNSLCSVKHVTLCG